MTITAIVLATASLGLLLLVLAVRRMRRRRLLAGLTNGSLALVLLLCAALSFTVSTNLHTYKRLTREREVAELAFERLEPRQFRVAVIDPESGASSSFELKGDEWQLDARILKWRGLANVLGLDAHYRLERLSGRYHDINLEHSEPRTVYRLSEQAGLDLWHLAQQYPRWLPFADAIYGSATYLPMADGARYKVSITQSGLIARPTNVQAREILKEWN